MTFILDSLLLERLLDMLSQILSAQPYKVLGAPSTYMSRNEVSVLARDVNPAQVTPLSPSILNMLTRPKTQVNGKSPELITLALSTLGSFDFSGKRTHHETFQKLPAHIRCC